jgi:DNA-binding LacI/PurR family transcriptional regulator
LRTVAQPCGPGAAGVRECLAGIDAELPGVSALVVHNEEALLPLLAELRAGGRRVPEDLAIVAVCPRDVAVSLPVRLTSADIPAHEVGTLAVETAMTLLDGRRTPGVRLLPPTIVERDSCSSGP